MAIRRVGVFVLAVAVGTAGCSSLRVKTSHDTSIDLSRYSTFRILPSNEVKRADVREFLDGALTAQLSARGLRPATSGADLLVSYHVRLTGGKSNPSAFGYSWNDGWDVYYGTFVPFGSTEAGRELAPGILIVDLVDASAMRLVWQGTAAGTLDPQAAADEGAAKVTSALEKMFAAYPRKS